MRWIIALLLATNCLYAQDNYPKEYFRSPLDIPLQLSGNFGELRSNHFHAGLDFKTLQRENLPIYAAAEGYVSRIKISSYGYGKAIYITHPNGYTTLYGHLNAGFGEIDDYIKKQHYAKTNFEIEVFPQPNELPVKKGQQIAWSGNTGGSGGPHLHFEIRDSKTEEIINPFHFGFDKMIGDSKKPVLNQVFLYPISEDATINGHRVPVLVDLKSISGVWTATPVSVTGKIGIGITGTDSQNGSENKNGIYQTQVKDNGQVVFQYTFDRMAFSEGRYLNALIDYARFKRTSSKVQRLFYKQPYPLSILQAINAGQITVNPNETHQVELVLRDFHGNTTKASIPLKGSAAVGAISPVDTISGYYLRAQIDNHYDLNGASVFVPAGTLYEDQWIDFKVENQTVTFGNETVPLHQNITVQMPISWTSHPKWEQVFIGLRKGKSVSYIDTKIKGDQLVAYTRNPGTYVIGIDSIAPKIAGFNTIEGKWISKQTQISGTISDNLSGIKSYNLFLNGKWALLDYDYKTRTIKHVFDAYSPVVDGRNEVRIEVVDNAGNSTIFETHFFRSVQP